MPALDFPNSPTNGQVFGGYIYDSTKGAWRVSPTTAAAVISSPTAPSSPVAGNIWFNTNDGVFFVYYADGDSSQWIELKSNTSIGSTVPPRVDALETANATTNKSGLVPIVPTSVTLGSGTSTISSNGQVTFTSASSVSLNGVFSSTYRNYKIVMSENGTASANLAFRLRVGTTDDATGNYSFGCYEIPRSGANLTYQGSDQTFAYISSTSANQYRGGRTIELQSPYDSSVWTNYQAFSSDAYYLGLVITGGMYTVGKLFDGISIVPTGNISGSIQVYGYR